MMAGRKQAAQTAKMMAGRKQAALTAKKSTGVGVGG